MKKLLLRVLRTLFLLSAVNAPAQSTTPAVEKIGPGLVRATENAATFNLTEAVEPVYPEEAKSQHIAGKVIVKALINKEGKVEEASPLEGDPLLGAATVAAVKQWRFRPYVFYNETVSIQTTVTARFTLDPPAVTVPKPRPANLKLRVSQGVAERMILHRVNPHYPEEAKRNGVQGDVLMQAVIDTKGDVTELKVMRGDPLLAAASVEAARQWKYRPYSLNGQPVEVQTTILFTFHMGR